MWHGAGPPSWQYAYATPLVLQFNMIPNLLRFRTHMSGCMQLLGCGAGGAAWPSPSFALSLLLVIHSHCTGYLHACMLHLPSTGSVCHVSASRHGALVSMVLHGGMREKLQEASFFCLMCNRSSRCRHYAVCTLGCMA